MVAVKAGRRFQIVTPQIEEILKAVHFYRYVTALDMAHLLYSPTSLTYVRERLSELSGGADFVTNQYLYRFRLPSITAGNSQRVFTLGSRGRDYLARELGLPVEWYFRPDKVKNMGYNQMLHNVILTRFLVAAKAWCAAHPDYELARVRICYELAEKPATVTITQEGQRRALKVIPDAWLEVRRGSDGKRFPVLLEIDRGTQYQRKFREHVRSRIEYLRSGAYRETFGTEAVLIAYATTGAKVAAVATRRATLCAWTNELLAEMHKRNWATTFRFHALALDGMYRGAFFDQPVWYRPDKASPAPLFG